MSRTGRVLALDVGDVRIGVAVTDPTRTIASPFPSTGLAAVPEAVGGVCPLPAAEPVPVAPAFTG